MSDAQKTLRYSIISGLSKNAHITGASINCVDIQVKDLMDEIFHPSTVWAIILSYDVYCDDCKMERRYSTGRAPKWLLNRLKEWQTCGSKKQFSL